MRTRRGTQVAAAVFTAALLSLTGPGLTGCAADDAGDGDGDGHGSAKPTSAQTRTAPELTASPGTAPERRLVAMTVSGGFAGVQQEVVLHTDGTVRTSDKGDSEVRRTSAARFERVRTLLADPALDDVPDVTRDPGAADLFQYTLRFDGRTVTTDRSTERPALDRLIDALDDWLSAH
ncbi:hypothetical protein ACLVWQ_04835 [Streptomyces sp. CWNU-52B]|uniref:hypothetical protein n=1 Tax=unclassified Streptomyces TaxID=2593676 RepID=UPI0039BFD7C9